MPKSWRDTLYMLIRKPKEMKLAYLSFYSDRESFFAESIFTVILIVSGITVIVSQSVSTSLLILRLLRMTCIAFVYRYVFITKRHTGGVGKTTYSSVVHSSNHFIVAWQIIGALVLLHESVYMPSCTGARISGNVNSYCNPGSEFRRLPSEPIYSNLTLLIAFPIIFKVHSSMAIFMSYFIFLFSVVAAIFLSSAYKDIPVLLTCCIMTGFALYDLEVSRLQLFISHQKAEKYFEDTLQAERSKQASEHEKLFLCSVLGNVAHDLKTPLQSFLSEVGVLEDLLKPVLSCLSGPESEQQREQIACILSSVKDVYSFMMLAINRGLEFNKIMTGMALQTQCETFCVGSAVQWVLARFKGSGVVPIHFSREECDRTLSPFVITDKHWFRENLMSLLSNALKFTASGSVDITCTLCELTDTAASLIDEPRPTEQQHESSVVVNIAKLSDFLKRSVDNSSQSRGVQQFIVLQVQDSGIGIPQEKMSTLFLPFRQMQRKAGGTGLGLFSVSKRMETLNGYCGAIQREDGEAGTCFWLAYPYVPDWSMVKTDPFAHAASTADTERSPVSGSIRIWELIQDLPQVKKATLPFSASDPIWRRILLVEDSPLIIKAITRLLARAGYEVEVEKNGSAGLDRMKKSRYVAVLSDIQMPIMDGFEMVRRFREYEADHSRGGVCRQLIVGMSANSDAENEKEALSSGMDYFIAKPIMPSSFRACLVAEYIEKGRKDKLV